MPTKPSSPHFVAPMLAAKSAPFDSDAHLFELKWDGIRALAFVEKRGYRLLTRHGRDVTEAFPELAALAGIGAGTVLDGELVVLRGGVPDLGAVQSRHHAVDRRRIRHLARRRPATYVAFDLLYVNRHSVMDEPLVERRRRLQELVTAVGDPRIVFSEGVIGSGQALFAEVCRRGLEGVMAKRLDGRYRPGRRTRAWLKIKPTGKAGPRSFHPKSERSSSHGT